MSFSYKKKKRQSKHNSKLRFKNKRISKKRGGRRLFSKKYHKMRGGSTPTDSDTIKNVIIALGKILKDYSVHKGKILEVALKDVSNTGGKEVLTAEALQTLENKALVEASLMELMKNENIDSSNQPGAASVPSAPANTPNLEVLGKELATECASETTFDFEKLKPKIKEYIELLKKSFEDDSEKVNITLIKEYLAAGKKIHECLKAKGFEDDELNGKFEKALQLGDKKTAPTPDAAALQEQELAAARIQAESAGVNEQYEGAAAATAESTGGEEGGGGKGGAESYLDVDQEQVQEEDEEEQDQEEDE